jgi:hypothetical protein
LKNIFGLILTMIQNLMVIIGIWFSSVFIYYTMTSSQNLTHSAKWVCLGISIIIYLVLTWACYKWGFK